MHLEDHQQFIRTFYQDRSWYDYSIFIRTNFLTEEVGEVCQAVRALEIGRDRPDEEETNRAQKLAHLTEELGDVLDNLLLIADKYDLSLDTIMQQHQQKLIQRYQHLPKL